MSEPITQTVHFTIKVRSFDRDDHWATECEQTSVFTYGETREDAERLNSEAHVAMVQIAKLGGQDALAEFMDASGIEYRLGGSPDRAEGMISAFSGGYWHGELAQAA